MEQKDILKAKALSKKELRKAYKIAIKYKAIAYINLEDEKLLWMLIKWLAELPCYFIINSDHVIDKSIKNITCNTNLNDDLLNAFDIEVTDNFRWVDFYVNNLIVPIIKKWKSRILTEFDPKESVWNAFFYENNNECSIFYAIIRYLENYKFPYDNKTCVSNLILETIKK